VSPNVYVETSALLRTVLDGDETLRPLVLGEGRYTSALTFAEAARAILRARRDGRLDARGAREARQRIAQFGRACAIVSVDDVVLERAGQEFPVEPVRTLDAIHVATVVALNAAAIDIDVLNTDARVRENATALGFAVFPTAAP
jgi:predicted nucleic acid-binding protein